MPLIRAAAVLGLLLAGAASASECSISKHAMFDDGFEIGAEARTVVVTRTINRGEYSGRKLSACRLELDCDIPPGTKKFGFEMARIGTTVSPTTVFRAGDVVRLDEKKCAIARVVPGDNGRLYTLPLPPEKRRELLGAPNK